MSTAQDHINDYWTGRAPAYDAYQLRPERLDDDLAAWREVWSDALGEAPIDVLDVGTGSGYVACLLAELGHRVTGIDLAEGMLEIAREHATRLANPPRILPGDAVDPDFPAGGFDAVVGRYVMWTLREPDQAVARWRRLLRPGGTVAMVDSTWFPDNPGELGFYEPAARAALPLATAPSIEATATAMERGGLRDVTVTPLESLFELDRRHGVAPGHHVQLQYLITGRA